MKYLGQIGAFAFLMAISFVLVGCGGGGKDAPTAVSSSSNVKLGEEQSYEYGVTFAAPEGWEAASRQKKTIVMFKNPNLEGQSVYVKVPEPSELKTLATKEDAAKSGLTGEMIQIGNYVWMRKTQVSKDSNDDKYDNLVCATIQFGKVYTVFVRGFQNQNENSDGIMNAVLSKIKFAEETEAPAAQIDENTDFGAVDL